MLRSYKIWATFSVVALLLLSAGVTQAAVRTLSLGMSGSDVTALQQTLIAKGYLPAGSAVGRFGPATLAAVKKFQCAQKIVCSGSAYGTVGPTTRSALGLSGSTAAAPATVSAKNISMEVTGWIPYWRKDKGVADTIAHINQFTSVMPFGYTVMTDGTINDAMNWGVAPWTNLVTAARANHVKIIPTVMWSNGDAIDTVLSDSTTRQDQEDQIVNLVQDNNFDGIDIDYEGKYARTSPYFSLFLKELYKKLGNKYLYCTIEARTPVQDLYDGTPPDNATHYANDFAVINQNCDRVQLMTYDQETGDVTLNKAANQAPYIPVADPKWVEKVIALASQTISKKKLMIGVATYGYEWQATPLSESGFRYDLQWAFDPGYASEIEQQFGVQAVRNMAGELTISYLPGMASTAPPADSSTATTASNNPNLQTSVSSNTTAPAAAPSINILWWSDAQAIAQEAALAHNVGIKGIAIFKLDGGEDPGMWSVLPKATH